MVNIIIVGLGNHVKKNILPAIERSGFLNLRGCIVRDKKKYTGEYNFEIYESAEDVRDFYDWVYIATPISSHYSLCKFFIEKGKNVICEKPITVTDEERVKLEDLANEKTVRLVEVRMYKYHRQFEIMCDLVEQFRNEITYFKASFMIPKLPADDIRYQKEKLGGAYNDVGFYPCSIVKELFGEPKEKNEIVKIVKGFEVDTVGSAVYEYDEMLAQLEWGIGYPYKNEVSFFIADDHYYFPRAFSKPHDLDFCYYINGEAVDIDADDQFKNMLKSIVCFENK